jgi:ribonuclease P protein component
VPILEFTGAPGSPGRKPGLDQETQDVETHLPAEQSRARPPSRLSRAHGHQGRPDHPEPPPRHRPQEALGLSPEPSSRLSRLGLLTVLTRRADFLAAARARRRSSAGFTLQARRRSAEEAGEGVRVGFTCSKKVGNAVARNRAKRRLRAAAREILGAAGRPGWDYVLIGKAGETAALPFERLTGDLAAALEAVHAERRS